ncbi:unnamed protein product [Cylicostephanus goldi]|uniref:Uncharacterized protein n=1 Tax=Cylicostephanus goldi TaxID=71465 RepID=A0A3P6UX86_CYLGO|nr:unnamed protein product [Cylicostephanus goldi]
MVAGKVIVYGGRGALGTVVVEHFKKNDFVSFASSHQFLPPMMLQMPM